MPPNPRHLRLIALIVACLILLVVCLIWANLAFMYSRISGLPTSAEAAVWLLS